MMVHGREKMLGIDARTERSTKGGKIRKKKLTNHRVFGFIIKQFMYRFSFSYQWITIFLHSRQLNFQIWIVLAI